MVAYGFYGHPETGRRRLSRRLLSELNPGLNMASWCVLGDFNEILSQDEKEGGRPRAGNLMGDFRQALQDNILFDLGWKRLKLTWCNNHTNETFTRERLDRSVATSRWMNLFKHQIVDVLTTRQSNHMPILLEMKKDN